jgi:hypothetical protein
MVATSKHFDYLVAPVNALTVQTEPDRKTGKPVVTGVLVKDEPLKPSERFWRSLYARYGFNGSMFKYFRHHEVLDRIAQVDKDRLRLCIERDEASGTNRLLAVSSPGKPIVRHDDLLDTLTRYGGEEVRYADGSAPRRRRGRLQERSRCHAT